jgi:small subunit ribosomal protein S8
MDVIADFLTRIRNASSAKHEKLDVPTSKVKVGIATILQETGFIRSFKVARADRHGFMRVYLKYSEEGSPAIGNIQRVSKPGRRIYVRSDAVPRVRNGFGVAIVSTSQGIMSGDTALQKKLGGELICKIW